MKERILGYEIITLSTKDCVTEVFNSLTRSEDNSPCCKWMGCINPHSYAVSLSDSKFAEALNAADWVVPDGFGILLASMVFGGKIRERVTGSDVFFELLQRMNSKGGMSVFFLGSTEFTLELIQKKMVTDFPNVSIAGTYSPSFKETFPPVELEEMINKINACKPDVLWVGMTAPKQEKWIYENCSRLNVRFAAAIGAVFDFYSGQVKRSNPTFQRLGLEWLPRLLQKPSVLWRRMFISAPIFLWHIFMVKVIGKSRSS